MENYPFESPAEPLSSTAAWRTVGNALFSLVRLGVLLARGPGLETLAAVTDYRQRHERVNVVVT